jgi:5-methylcytosine-specific restriction enzyme A
VPRAAPRVCPHCRRVVPHGQRCPRTPDRSATTKFSSTRRFRKLREIKLNDEPHCEACGRPATQVDHIKPVSEHPQLALSYENLQSICRPCHQKKTNADRRRRSGKDDDDF